MAVMNQGFRDLPIRIKLSLIVLLAASLVIICLAAVFIAERSLSFRRNMVENISTLAAVIGTNSTAALAFDDPGTAREILAALGAEPDVLAAHIFLKDDTIFGSYQKKGLAADTTAGVRSLETVYRETISGPYFHDDYLDLSQPILLNDKEIGHLAIRADLTHLRNRLRLFTILALGGTLVVMALAYILCARLNRMITDPVTHLVATMERVSDSRDYTLRALKTSEDEHGKLIDGFNFMLSQIQRREEALAEHRDRLEDLVALRTKALQEANEKLQREIDERQKTQEALAKAQKMEAIGTLAAGVAHDLNNLLSGISSYPELLLVTLPEDSHLRGPLATIKESGEKAAAIVHDMLALARRSVTTLEVIDLQREIEAFLASNEMERLVLSHGEVAISTDFSAQMTTIAGSPVHLHKVLMNLLTNAVDAMPNGGNIAIKLGTVYVDRPMRGYDEVQKGEYVSLAVSDTGNGIEERYLDRIFEPFFSRKKLGRSGTGLGMAVVWGTVKDHNGYIEVESSVGEGTTFFLYFPLCRQEIKKVVPKQWEAYSGMGESVLVVDDAETQRKIASEILTTLGYKVATAESGEAAVAYVQDHSVDLVLLDMIMPPGIDGYETYRRMVAIDPRQRAVIASGYSESEQVRAAQKLGAGEYIRKPYTLANIAEAVHKALR
jgi:signal transduction histidine kinase